MRSKAWFYDLVEVAANVALILFWVLIWFAEFDRQIGR
jgi:hypothetical protein